ncbi:MAG: hypothetical protein U0W24_03900 [Bacteroidales bacterium]
MKSVFCVFILLFILSFSNFSSAQNIIYSNDKEGYVAKNPENENELKSNVKKNNKLDYSLNIGSSFLYSREFGNELNLWASPELKYKLAPKMNIHAGLMFINSTVSGYYMAEKQSANFNQVYGYAGIDYLATDKLLIRGDILYGLNKQYNTFSGKSNQYSFRFSAEYKINNNFSIGVQVINHNYSNPVYSNFLNTDPFGRANPVLDPFNW